MMVLRSSENFRLVSGRSPGRKQWQYKKHAAFKIQLNTGYVFPEKMIDE